MNRKEAANLLPIIQAFAEGKNIEYRSKGFNEDWKKVTQIPELSFESFEYRIKPEPKFRPFKDAEECWQEMLKHQPFGVVKDKYFANYQTHRAFTCLTTKGCYFCGYEDETFESSFKNLLFADGLPFGVKIEEN
ncbi:hypothetical protein [Streptococcus vestibularis]|uniref:hypothetical protein n=1 Tax=Streptococcus vestibularis TaxID=1343 RepID=UPI0026F21A90|nr:hypothetical protein [Streptococcus vestibularis]